MYMTLKKVWLNEIAMIEKLEKDNFGRTPLHWAVLNGEVALVKLILERKVADIDEEGFDGLSPLRLAISRNDMIMVNLLLDYGAKLYHPCSDGVSPLAELCVLGTAHPSSVVAGDSPILATSVPRKPIKIAEEFKCKRLEH